MVVGRVVILFVVLALTGCSAATEPQTAAPRSTSDGAQTTSPPRIGGPDAGGGASFSGSSSVGAGSFPRAFLIPGTDTSIRIGG
jgi:hypothetical protein